MSAATKMKMWRDSASMIIFAKKATAKMPSSSKTDYELLMLRRSGKSKFMPNTFVFPGGVLSASDRDPGWAEVFRKFGSRSHEEVVAPASADRRRPLLMQGDEEGGLLPLDAAFRLCAIRETFEESGIFVGTDREAASGEELRGWRDRVHKDPSALLALCHHFEVSPDIWSLSEWSCWLTPLFRNDPGNRRFDTIFYSVYLEERPAGASEDDKEMTAMRWGDPDEILTEHHTGDIVLAPPQVYELTRMRTVSAMSELRDFSKRLEPMGVNTWLPVIYPCSDGFISVLPGDELYPEEPDFTGERDLPPSPLLMDLTGEEACKKYGTRMNRGVVKSGKPPLGKTMINISSPMEVVLQDTNCVLRTDIMGTS